MWDLTSLTRISLEPPALEGKVLAWTTREVPTLYIFTLSFLVHKADLYGLHIFSAFACVKCCFWALTILLSPAYNFKTQLRCQHLLEDFPNYPTLQWRDTYMYTILVILHLPGLTCSGGWRELVESRNAVQWAQHPQGSISLIGLHKHLLEWLEYPESFWVDPSSWVL